MDANEFIKLRDDLLQPCDIGDLDNVKLAHNQLMNIKSTNHHEYETILTFAFCRATEYGQLNVLQYLIDEHLDEFHQDVLDVDLFFCSTCMYEQPELAKYILERNKIKETGLNIIDSFKYANKYRLIDVIQFLIFDYHVEQNDEINNFLQEEPSMEEDIKNMFKIRDLKTNLNDELNNNSQDLTHKKLKI